MCYCWTRHEVVALTLLSTSLLFANILTFNFATITFPVKQRLDERIRVVRQVANESDVVNQPHLLHNSSDVIVQIDVSTSTSLDTVSNVTESAVTQLSDNITDDVTTIAIRPQQTTTNGNDLHHRPSALEPDEELWQLNQQIFLNALVGLVMLIFLPITYFAVHAFGARYFMFMALMASAVATSGMALGFNSAALLFCLRALQALCASVILPLISLVLTNWASINNRPLFLAYMLMFVPMGAFICNLVSAIVHIAHVTIWVSFHAHAILSSLAAILWLYYYRDMPQRHPHISGVELDKILTGKGVSNRAHNVKLSEVPWKRIVVSYQVIALLFSSFCHYFILFFVAFYAPWLVHAFGSDIDSKVAGFNSTIPFLLHLVALFVSAVSALRYKDVDDTKRTKVFATVAFGASFLFAVVAITVIIASENAVKHAVVACFMLITMAIGANGGGIHRSVCTLARQHAHAVVTLIGCVMCIVIIVMNILMRVSDSWLLMFIFMSVLSLAGLGVYAFAGGAERAKWTIHKEGGVDFAESNDNDADCMEAGILELRVLHNGKTLS